MDSYNIYVCQCCKIIPKTVSFMCTRSTRNMCKIYDCDKSTNFYPKSPLYLESEICSTTILPAYIKELKYFSAVFASKFIQLCFKF